MIQKTINIIFSLIINQLRHLLLAMKCLKKRHMEYIMHSHGVRQSKSVCFRTNALLYLTGAKPKRQELLGASVSAHQIELFGAEHLMLALHKGHMASGCMSTALVPVLGQPS